MKYLVLATWVPILLFFGVCLLDWRRGSCVLRAAITLANLYSKHRKQCQCFNWLNEFAFAKPTNGGRQSQSYCVRELVSSIGTSVCPSDTHPQELGTSTNIRGPRPPRQPLTSAVAETCSKTKLIKWSDLHYSQKANLNYKIEMARSTLGERALLSWLCCLKIIKKTILKWCEVKLVSS